MSVMAWSSTTIDVSHMHPSLVCEGQSRVYQSLCVVARSASLLVLGCSAQSGYCAKGVGKEKWLWEGCRCTTTKNVVLRKSTRAHGCQTKHRTLLKGVSSVDVVFSCVNYFLTLL